jgi:hypothetical protein
MSIFSRLFGRRKQGEDPDEVARRVYAAFARSRDMLPPPDIRLSFKCECGLPLSAGLRNFNPVGGHEVECAQCGAVTFFPPEILDHTHVWAEFKSASLREDWQQLIKVTRHGRKS